MDPIQLHTFVVMAYKSAPYLEDTIQSLLKQKTKTNIVISTSTPNEHIHYIAEKYGIKLFINDNPSDISRDWTFAVGCANTPLVTLADQDDNYQPDYASTVIDRYNKNKDSILIFSNYVEIDDSGKKRKMNLTMLVKHILIWPFYIVSIQRSKFIKELILRFGDPICSPSITFNLAVIGSHPMFDPDYSIALDWDAWLRMAALKGAFCFIRRPLLHHRIHAGTQTTAGIQGGKRYSEDLSILCRLWPAFIARLILKFYTRSYHSN